MGHIDLTLTTHRQFYQEIGWLASEEPAGVNVNKDWPRAGRLSCNRVGGLSLDYSMTGSPTSTS